MPFDEIKRGRPERGAGERAINLPPAISKLCRTQASAPCSPLFALACRRASPKVLPRVAA